MVQLFASALKRDSDGRFWIKTPFERAEVQVEDAPFIAVALTFREADGKTELCFRTNLDEEVTADRMHPLRIRRHPQTATPLPYILVRDGLEARLSRPVYYELTALAKLQTIENKEFFGVESKGIFFPIEPEQED